MTPWRIANKLRGECSYHTPLRVVLSTKKLSSVGCCRVEEEAVKSHELLGNVEEYVDSP
jgi:hypothetical protein